MLNAWQIGSQRIKQEFLFRCSQLLTQIPTRYQTGYSYGSGDYHGSAVVDDKNPDKYTKVEKSTAEWKYVEKLIPPALVPQAPLDPNINYASGWSPPKITTPDQCNLPYYIPRTKNHMIPVYLFIYKPERGLVRRTIIKHVEGNIWALEKELAAYLQAKYPDIVIVTWVNESWRRVTVRGEYVNDVMEWAVEKGF